MPLVLWNKDGASEEEQDWTTTFENIFNKCVDHVVENREELELFEITRSDLQKSKGGMSGGLYWKKEKFTENGKTIMRVVPGSGPTLYAKLIFSKKNEKFISSFYDMNDEKLDPLTLMGKYCFTNAAIKIESVFIGARVSLQVKIYEANVEPQASGMRRLLQRPKCISKVIENDSINMMSSIGEDVSKVNLDDDDDEGSLAGSDVEETSSPKKTVVKRKVIKKVVKKVAS